ncbi:MAG: NAD(P)/FAD-dependent oxidoreductase [Candidatus Sericytochromatia bacterium]
MSFDVAIIGAGPAGLALSIQLSKLGKKIVLIDKDEKEKIGHHFGAGVIKLDAFMSTGIKRSSGEELLGFIDNFNVYTPTGKNFKNTTYSGIVVDRNLFTKRLLAMAEEQGVILKDHTEIKAYNLENNFIKGVTTTSDEVIEAKIVVDASGFGRKLINTLPDSFKIEKEIKRKDIARGFVYVFDKPEKNGTLTAYLAINEGYVWKTPVEVGYGSINPDANLKDTLDNFIKQHFKLENQVAKEYSGSLPVRQNIYNMVGNGLLLCGDNACMTNPMEGTGIATGMIGSKIASETINKCLEKNDFSQNALWEFNLNYNKTQGANLAYMDMLRRGLIGLSPDDMDFAFEKDIITSKDVYDSITGAIANVSSLDKAQRALRGLRRPGILLRMENCMNKSKELKNHYINYPDNISKLDSWISKLNDLNNSFT